MSTRRVTGKFILAVITVGILCTLMIAHMAYAARPALSQVDLSPATSNDAAGWRVYTLHDGRQKDLTYRPESFAFFELDYEGQPFYMSRTLEQVFHPQFSPTLFLGATDETSVYLDDKLIFEYKADEYTLDNPKLTEDGAPMIDQIYVTLPVDYIGKTLTIRQVSPEGSGMAAVPPVIRLMNTMLMDGTDAAAETLAYAYPMIGLFLTGLCLCVLFVMQVWASRPSLHILLLILYAFLQASRLSFNLPLASEPELLLPFFHASYKFILLPLLLYFIIRLKNQRVPVLILTAVYVIANIPFVESWLLELYFPLFSCIDWALIITAALLWILRAEFRKNRVMKRVLMIAAIVSTLVTAGFPAYFAAFFEEAINYAGVGESIYDYLARVYLNIGMYASILLAAGCAAATAYDFYRTAARKNMKLNVLEAKEQLAVSSYENLQNYANQVAVLRHDMRHHLMALQTILKEGNLERASGYIERIVEEEKGIDAVSLTQNYLVSNIVNHYLNEMNKLEIKADFHEIDLPKELPISDHDLVSVLSNLFDNAVEAAGRVPQKEKRTVTFRAWLNDHYLMLKLSNSFAEKPVFQNGRFLSNKREPLHGYGLDIISRVAERNHGAAVFKIEDGLFVSTVSMRLSAISTNAPASVS